MEKVRFQRQLAAITSAFEPVCRAIAALEPGWPADARCWTLEAAKECYGLYRLTAMYESRRRDSITVVLTIIDRRVFSDNGDDGPFDNDYEVIEVSFASSQTGTRALTNDDLQHIAPNFVACKIALNDPVCCTVAVVAWSEHAIIRCRAGHRIEEREDERIAWRTQCSTLGDYRRAQRAAEAQLESERARLRAAKLVSANA